MLESTCRFKSFFLKIKGALLLFESELKFFEVFVSYISNNLSFLIYLYIIMVDVTFCRFSSVCLP